MGWVDIGEEGVGWGGGVVAHLQSVGLHFSIGVVILHTLEEAFQKPEAEDSTIVRIQYLTWDLNTSVMLITPPRPREESQFRDAIIVGLIPRRSNDAIPAVTTHELKPLPDRTRMCFHRVIVERITKV